jgi:ABC-2 type transport system ATP-binding protein
VIIINQGRIIAEDTPASLTKQIQKQKGLQTSVYVEGPTDDVKRKLSSIQGVFSVGVSEKKGEFIVESISDENIRPMIARAIVESNWLLREMRSIDLSLEEVFIHLVTEENRDIEL